MRCCLSCLGRLLIPRHDCGRSIKKNSFSWLLHSLGHLAARELWQEPPPSATWSVKFMQSHETQSHDVSIPSLAVSPRAVLCARRISAVLIGPGSGTTTTVCGIGLANCVSLLKCQPINMISIYRHGAWKKSENGEVYFIRSTVAISQYSKGWFGWFAQRIDWSSDAVSEIVRRVRWGRNPLLSTDAGFCQRINRHRIGCYRSHGHRVE